MALAGPPPSFATEAGGPDVTPDAVPGNPTCADLGYAHEVKVDPPTLLGTAELGTGDVNWSHDGYRLDWDSTYGVDAVIVKGGDAGNVYVYDPPAESLGDTGLVSPLNDGGNLPTISHFNFCYDYELEVTKTATTSYERTYNWTITKIGNATDLVMAEGQTHKVDYDVTVGLAGTTPHTDDDWAVDGVITVENPDPTQDAIVTDVTDVVSGGIPYADVTCEVLFPHSLEAGGSFECTYYTDLPDGTARNNTATATVAANSPVDGDSGTAAVTFGDPTTLVDECIDVDDDQFGPLGTACVSDPLPKTFEYSLSVGPYADCGDYEFTNVASFDPEGGEPVSDSWTVDISVVCGDNGGGEGCTLTQGYWKTHSEHGPAPYDDNWENLADGADTAFFDSGMSYHDVLWTPPKGGNAYFTLAHQYIAAELNILNGADGEDITSEMDAAAALFAGQGPWDTTLSKPETKLAKSLASTLDNYNNGLIGPGHCSE